MIKNSISSDELRKKHWEGIFNRNDYTQVLWHQSSPNKSMTFIKEYSASKAKIIDVGCGASNFVDKLLEDGYKNITLLDTSKTSLDIVKNRLGNKDINYICQDILNFQTSEKFDIWHDRAVFHFLLSQKDREKYFEVLNDSLNSGAIAIISTFMTGGPIQCAGLDIVQYDEKKMLCELPSNLELIKSEEYIHITPKQSEQKYIYFVIRKS